MKRGIITLMALALTLPLAALAQPGPGNGPGCGPGMGMGMDNGPFMPDRHNHMMGRGGPGFMMMADELALTDQQRTQLKEMQTTFRLAMIDREAAVDKAEVQLRSAMMDDKATEAEVARLIDETSRLRAEVQKLRFSHHKQMTGVLTAEQLKKFEELRQDRREERRGDGQGQGMGRCVPGCGKHSRGGRP